MKTVAIIGGGITGLTAAFRLVQAGASVTVYEGSNRVGGAIQSIRQDRFLAECGPNTILETSPKISQLICDLGLERRRVYSDPASSDRFLVRDGQLVRLPGTVSEFIGTTLFSPAAKLRLLAEPFLKRSDPCREESVADFVTRRLGQEFLDYAINPLVGGIYAGDPARLSVKEAFPKLLAVEQRYGSLIRGQIFGARERKKRGEMSKQNAPKFSFDDGLQVLTDELQERLGLQIATECPVTGIEKRDSGWFITVGAGERPKSGPYAAVLFAGTAYRLAQLRIEAEGAPDLGGLAEIRYPAVASVAIGFRREQVAHPLNGFGVLIPEKEGFDTLGTIFSSSLFPDRAPAGHVLLTSYLGGARNERLPLKNKIAMADLALADLSQLLGIRGEPVFTHHSYFAQAIPQYELGFGRFKRLMTEAETKCPGLFFAGHYRDGISLGDSIVSGHDIATRVVAHIRNPRPNLQPLETVNA